MSPDFANFSPMSLPVSRYEEDFTPTVRYVRHLACSGPFETEDLV